MFNKKISEHPKLNFTHKKKTWKRSNEPPFYTPNSKSKRDNLKNNKIIKIQKVSDLKKIKHMFENLREEGDNCIIYGQCHECYLSNENDAVEIITMEDYIYCREFETKFGKIISENHGEFGGVLYNITDNGEEFMTFGESFEYIFEYDNKVYAITSLCHLGGFDCSLHELKKFNDKYEDITIFTSWDLDFAGYYIKENFLYFYSNSEYNGLYRFNLNNNQLEIIAKDLCSQIEVNSLIKNNQYIYIYGNYNIVEYNLKTNEIKSIYTNLNYEDISELMYVNNEKLIDLWEKIII